MMDNFKNAMINLDKKKFNDIKKLYPITVKNANKNANFNFKLNQAKDNVYIKYLENNKKTMYSSNKLPISASMSNLTAKSYNVFNNINVNFFKKRKNLNNISNSNISTKMKLLLLPNINT